MQFHMQKFERFCNFLVFFFLLMQLMREKGSVENCRLKVWAVQSQNNHYLKDLIWFIVIQVMTMKRFKAHIIIFTKAQIWCFWFRLISHRRNLTFCIGDYLHIEKAFQTEWPLEVADLQNEIVVRKYLFGRNWFNLWQNVWYFSLFMNP